MVSGGLTCISGGLVDGEIRPLSLTILAQGVAAGFCETESKHTGAPEVQAQNWTPLVPHFPNQAEGSPDSRGEDVDANSQWEDLQGHITRVCLPGKVKN